MSTTIADALRLILEPGQVTELRALDAVTHGYRRPHVESGYFDDVEKLAAAAASITTAKGIYFTPNPVKPALLARAANRIRPAGKDPLTSDHDTTARRWLLIDCDPVRPAGISAMDDEHLAARERAVRICKDLQARGWPWPILSDSGNGAHLLYRIDLPTDDGGTVQKCLEALAAEYDDEAVTIDQTVYNPARIWKLYGTWARKGDSTPERPHRQASIIKAPEPLELVSRGLLEALAAESTTATQPANTTRPAASRRGRINESPDALKTYLASCGVDVKAVKERKRAGHVLVLDRCPMNPDHGKGSDTAVVLLSDGTVGFECKHNGCADHKWRDLRAKIDPERVQLAPKVKAPPEPAAPILPFTPFPVAALPEPVRGFVRKASRAIGCDPSYLGLPLLAGLAAAVGNTRRIRLKRGWSEPAILWAVIVGDSGTLKSPALELALRAIRRRQRGAMKQYKQAAEAYQTDLAHYEREMTAWKRSKTETDPPVKPAYPVADRYWADDVTVEALAVLLLNQWRGLLLPRDELSGWLGSFDRYSQGKGGDAAKWLEMFGGRPMMVDRKSGNQPTIYVDRAAVSIAGGIQPETLRRALGVEHRENGLAARLLLTYPPRKAKRWTEADIDPATEADIENVFNRLYDLQPDTDDDGEPRPRIVTMTPTGKAAWVTFYNEHATEHADLSGDLSAAWSKLEGSAARLALVVHFVRWAADDATLADPDRVDETSIAAGVELSRWFGHETRRIYGILGESEDDRDRRRLAEWIERRGGGVTVRELTHGPRQYRGNGQVRATGGARGEYQTVVDEDASETLLEHCMDGELRGGGR